MDESMEEKIKEALKDVKAWQRVPTSLDGVYLVKTPSSAGRESIMVEINPSDERGNPLKRRGIYMRKVSDLESFIEVMQDEKLKEVLLTLEKISGISHEDKIKPVEL
jgi:hypothetical protein